MAARLSSTALRVVAGVGAAAALLIAGAPAVDAGEGQEDARKAAAQRRRRIIFNNDGDDALHYAMFTKQPEVPATKEGFLAIRMDHIGGCGIDSVFYCTTQSFNAFTHDSKVTEVFGTTEGAFANNRTTDLIKLGADPLAVAIEACRQRDIEVFYTIRMNDIHDNFWYEMLSEWKKDNPELLLGKRADKEGHPFSDPRHVWTLADFARKEVRDRMVAIVADIPDRYDVDGIDLDFLRHPAYFQETRDRKPVTGEHMAGLTDMVAGIRRAVLAASKRKKKPILLSARVLPTLELNRHQGFDVEQWVKRGYVDFIAIGGGYDPFTMPVQDLIARGHEWGIPVYVCGSSSGMRPGAGVTGSRIGGTIECWRAFAANAWHAGADGLMTFNLFPNMPGSQATKSARRIWSELGDRQSLADRDKLFCIENLENLANTCFMFDTVPVAGRLPVAVSRGGSVNRVLPVGDDIPALAHRVKALELRICLSGLEAEDRVSVKVNGTTVSMSPEEGPWLAGQVAAASMRKGVNQVTVAYESGKSESLRILSVELAVKYNAREPVTP